MIGLDTNVLVRVITRDDPEQLEAALAVMAEKRLFVAKTVLLELEWVLRHAYGFNRQAISGALLKLLGLSHLVVEDRATVIRAHERYATGMDFANALHLASSASAACFATFDRKLARAACDAKAMPQVDLLGARHGSAP